MQIGMADGEHARLEQADEAVAPGAAIGVAAMLTREGVHT
jgi:hypothetical protein